MSDAALPPDPHPGTPTPPPLPRNPGSVDSALESVGGIRVRYAPVRLDKFIAMSVLTGGVYHIVWLFRMWRSVKADEGSDAWPWARGLFGPIFYYSLVKRFGDVRGPVGLAAGFLLINAAWRAPDPWWLLSLLAFLPLLPLLLVVNAMNGEGARRHASYGWRIRSSLVGAAGAIVMFFAIIGTFGPPTRVVAGDEMRVSHMEFLTSTGILQEGETLLYFYSPGFMSIRGEGVIASDWGITSYWVDPVDEELSIAFLTFVEIVAVDVNRAETEWDATFVRVEADDGSWFNFVLSSEEGGDQEFLDELEARRLAASQPGRVSARP